MRPTSVELLESIAQALEDQVLPLMQDKWGASTLRSAMQLLRHLALRVPFEARILAADNEDVRRVLTLVHDELTQIGESDLASSRCGSAWRESRGPARCHRDRRSERNVSACGRGDRRGARSPAGSRRSAADPCGARRISAAAARARTRDVPPGISEPSFLIESTWCNLLRRIPSNDS